MQGNFFEICFHGWNFSRWISNIIDIGMTSHIYYLLKNIIINFETLISGCLKYIVWSKIILLISVHIISDSSCPHYNKNSLKPGLLINYAVYKIPFYERTLQKYVYIFVHFLITEHEHYLLNNFEWRNKCNNEHRPEVKNEVLIYIFQDEIAFNIYDISWQHFCINIIDMKLWWCIKVKNCVCMIKGRCSRISS